VGQLFGRREVDVGQRTAGCHAFLDQLRNRSLPRVRQLYHPGGPEPIHVSTRRVMKPPQKMPPVPVDGGGALEPGEDPVDALEHLRGRLVAVLRPRRGPALQDVLEPCDVPATVELGPVDRRGEEPPHRCRDLEWFGGVHLCQFLADVPDLAQEIAQVVSPFVRQRLLTGNGQPLFVLAGGVPE